MFNEVLYGAPDTHSTFAHLRKYAPAKWLKYQLGEAKIDKLKATIKATLHYYKSVHLSIVLHEGCKRDHDGKGGWTSIKPGTGPKSKPLMNCGDAYLAWSGYGSFKNEPLRIQTV